METNKRKARAWITGEQHGHQWEAIILPPDSCSQAKPVGNKEALTLCSAAVVNTKKQVVQVHFRSHFCPYIQKKAHRWPLCYQHRHRCQGCEIREPSSSCRLPQVGTDKSSAESSKAPGRVYFVGILVKIYLCTQLLVSGHCRTANSPEWLRMVMLWEEEVGLRVQQYPSGVFCVSGARYMAGLKRNTEEKQWIWGKKVQKGDWTAKFIRVVQELQMHVNTNIYMV